MGQPRALIANRKLGRTVDTLDRVFDLDIEVVERKGEIRCKSWRPHRTDGQGFGVFGLQVRVASDRGENRIAQLGKTGWNARGLTVLVDHGRWQIGRAHV